jgi:PAS domain-containing protein
MGRDTELIALINLIYEAALDSDLWPSVLVRLADMGANLLVEDQFSALICFSNAPGKDSLTAEQIHIFEAFLRHLTRAVRISRRLWELELKHVAATERLETLQQGALLADASGRVVRANAAAKAAGQRTSRRRLRNFAKADCLMHPNLSRAWRPRREFKIPRELPRSPLHVTVTPLRSKARLSDVPWIGVGTPVAIVTVRDPDIDRRRQEVNLRRRFGLTAGDGRAAAARRGGISATTNPSFKHFREDRNPPAG